VCIKYSVSERPVSERGRDISQDDVSEYVLAFKNVSEYVFGTNSKKGQKIGPHVLNPRSLLHLLRFRFTIQEAQGVT